MLPSCEILGSEGLSVSDLGELVHVDEGESRSRLELFNSVLACGTTSGRDSWFRCEVTRNGTVVAGLTLARSISLLGDLSGAGRE